MRFSNKELEAQIENLREHLRLAGKRMQAERRKRQRAIEELEAKVKRLTSELEAKP